MNGTIFALDSEYGWGGRWREVDRGCVGEAERERGGGRKVEEGKKEEQGGRGGWTVNPLLHARLHC